MVPLLCFFVNTKILVTNIWWMFGYVVDILYIYRQAWKQLGDMEAEQAMQEYIACINVLDPEGSTKVTTNPNIFSFLTSKDLMR